MDDRPIGMFDSGFGGLTVARALIDLLPAEEGAVAKSTVADAAAARKPTAGTLCAHAPIPRLPVLLPPPENPCLFSSA